MGWDDITDALGTDSPAAKKLRAIGEQLAPNVFVDPDRDELLEIYDDMNDRGRQTLMDVARGLAANPDMNKDGGSKNGTA